MKLLKKENWWVWLLVLLFGGGTGIIALGALLDTLKKDSWYTKWWIWVLGILAFNMAPIVFCLQITSLVAAKLDVKGKEYYLSPYIWIIMLIIPILGWVAFVGLVLYLNIAILVNLYKGNGEKYID